MVSVNKNGGINASYAILGWWLRDLAELTLKISLEGKILLLLNLADALHTAFLIKTGLATELNPFMRVFLRYGTLTFVVGKIVGVSVLVLFLELLKSKGLYIRMIKSLQWVAIIWYVFAAFLFPYLQLFLYLIPGRLV